jgi:hypothetical protein
MAKEVEIYPMFSGPALLAAEYFYIKLACRGNVFYFEGVMKCVHCGGVRVEKTDFFKIKQNASKFKLSITHKSSTCPKPPAFVSKLSLFEKADIPKN